MDNTMREAIETALGLLDEASDEHWTKLGKPSVDAVNDLIDGKEKVTRDMIEEVRPGFVRHMAEDEGQPGEEGQEIGGTPVSAEDLTPIELMEIFCRKMQEGGGAWMKFNSPLASVMQSYLSNEPSIKEHYERAKSRGRL